MFNGVSSKIYLFSNDVKLYRAVMHNEDAAQLQENLNAFLIRNQRELF